jgi:hypothetical protein
VFPLAQHPVRTIQENKERLELNGIHTSAMHATLDLNGTLNVLRRRVHVLIRFESSVANM